MELSRFNSRRRAFQAASFLGTHLSVFGQHGQRDLKARIGAVLSPPVMDMP
jgi:hypothetical protein